MTQKTLEELQALQNRLETDIRRSRNADPDGLSRNSPLLKNYEQVQKDIKTIKETAGK
jgi:hypothetical protein